VSSCRNCVRNHNQEAALEPGGDCRSPVCPVISVTSNGWRGKIKPLQEAEIRSFRSNFQAKFRMGRTEICRQGCLFTTSSYEKQVQKHS